MFDDAPFDGIVMNVIPMMHKIDAISNSMIGKPPLPNLATASDHSSEIVGVCAFD